MARPTILQIGSPVLSSLMKREMRIKEASVTVSNKEGANSGHRASKCNGGFSNFSPNV